MFFYNIEYVPSNDGDGDDDSQRGDNADDDDGEEGEDEVDDDQECIFFYSCE